MEKIEDELDQWGRPKKRLSNPIDAMPEDMQVGFRGAVDAGHETQVQLPGLHD